MGKESQKKTQFFWILFSLQYFGSCLGLAAETREGVALAPDHSEIPVTRAETEKKWRDFDNPAGDGWSTEAFNEISGVVLKNLEKWLLQKQGNTPRVFTEEPRLHPVAEETASTMRRNVGDFRYESRNGVSDPVVIAGDEAILDHLRKHFLLPCRGDYRFKAKTIGVELKGEEEATTLVRIETLGSDEYFFREGVSHWSIDWIRDKKEYPRVSAIRVLAENFIARPVGTDGATTFFSDCTRSALGDDPAFAGQIAKPVSYWLERTLSGEFYGYTGIATGDPNGDGLEDFYVCESRYVPNLLFLQNPDGTFTNCAAGWNVDWIEDTRSALLVDLDNDGDDDLAVATDGFVVVAENTGEAFVFRSALTGPVDSTGLSAADYDRDGRLDLYVSGYFPPFASDRLANESVYPNLYLNAGLGEANRLYRNEWQASEGDREEVWSFRDTTKESGLDVGNRGLTLGAAWEDYDSDGDPDLYVANDFGRNVLYRNEGNGEFTDVSREVGAEDNAFGMSAAWGDPNRDGRMDLYIANMWSSAGKRVTTQRGFKPGIEEEDRATYQHLARGNTLLLQNSDGGFGDVSEDAGVTMGRWAWSSPFVDFNNDGWEDLFVANGFYTAPGPGDL